jgi:hypothetical protein
LCVGTGRERQEGEKSAKECGAHRPFSLVEGTAQLLHRLCYFLLPPALRAAAGKESRQVILDVSATGWKNLTFDLDGHGKRPTYQDKRFSNKNKWLISGWRKYSQGLFILGNGCSKTHQNRFHAASGTKKCESDPPEMKAHSDGEKLCFHRRRSVRQGLGLAAFERNPAGFSGGRGPRLFP